QTVAAVPPRGRLGRPRPDRLGVVPDRLVAPALSAAALADAVVIGPGIPRLVPPPRSLVRLGGGLPLAPVGADVARHPPPGGVLRQLPIHPCEGGGGLLPVPLPGVMFEPRRGPRRFIRSCGGRVPELNEAVMRRARGDVAAVGAERHAEHLA